MNETGTGAVLNVRHIPNVAELPPFAIPAEWHAAADPRCAILLVPALGIPARYYLPFAEACVSHGFSVLLPELPGSGTSRPRPSRRADYGYRDLWSRYLPGLVDAASRRSGNTPLVAVGHSVGAHLAMLAVMQETIDIAALVTIAAGNIHYRNWAGSGTWRVLLLAWLVTAMSHSMGSVRAHWFGLGGPHPRQLMGEWARLIRSGSYAHVADALPAQLSIPALSIGYEGDSLAPCKSVAGMAHMLGGEMEWLTVDWPGNPHASWARYPEETLRLVDGWLAARDIVKAPQASGHEVD